MDFQSWKMKNKINVFDAVAPAKFLRFTVSYFTNHNIEKPTLHKFNQDKYDEMDKAQDRR